MKGWALLDQLPERREVPLPHLAMPLVYLIPPKERDEAKTRIPHQRTKDDELVVGREGGNVVKLRPYDQRTTGQREMVKAFGPRLDPTGFVERDPYRSFVEIFVMASLDPVNEASLKSSGEVGGLPFADDIRPSQLPDHPVDDAFYVGVHFMFFVVPRHFLIFT